MVKSYFPEARPLSRRISAGTMPYMTGPTPIGFGAPAGAAVNTPVGSGSVTPTRPSSGDGPPPQLPPHNNGYGPYGPIPPQGPPPRRGSTIAIVTAIIVAGALIAAALLFRGGDTPPTAAPAEVTAPAVVEPGPTSPAPTGLSTCDAWAVAASKIDAAPSFPPGWSYETPGIQEFIANRVATFTPIYDAFEKQILPNPAHIKILAERAVAGGRGLLTILSAGTYVPGEDMPGLSASRALTTACSAE